MEARALRYLGLYSEGVRVRVCGDDRGDSSLKTDFHGDCSNVNELE